MSLTRNIAKNVGVQLVGRVIGTLLGLVTVALMTRYLGTAGFGQFTTATSYLQFIGVLVDFGLTLTIVQMLSEPGADEGRILGNIVTLRIATAIIVFAIAPLIALAINWSGDVHSAIAVGSISFIFLAIHQMFVGFFQRRMRMEISSLAEVLGRAVLLLGVWFVVRSHGSVAMLLGALAAGNLVMCAISFFFTKKIQPFSLRFEIPVIREVIRRSWPMALSILFNLVYLRGDMIILSLVRGESEVGLYGAAYKPLDVITVIPLMFMGLVLPLLVAAWSKRDIPRIERLVQRALDAISILAFGVLAGGIVLATPLMVLLSGQEFASAGPLLSLLIGAATCVFFGSIFGHVVVAIQKQRVMLWIYAADALASLVLYAIFIPRYGATAGAIITILSELIIAIGTTMVVLRTTKIRLVLTIPFRAAFAALAMALLLLITPSLPFIIRFMLGGTSYFAFLVLFKALTPSDLKALMSGRLRPTTNG